MMTFYLRTALLSLALAAPCIALAEEQGRITAMIDGEERSYNLTSSQSDWSGWGNGGGGSVSIIAGEDAPNGGWYDFSLGFRWAGDSASSPEISAKMDDTKLFGDEETGVSVTLASLAIDGDFLVVSGGFEGTIGPSDNRGRDIDEDGRVPISGTFDVTLGPVE